MNIIIRKASIDDLKSVQKLNYKLFDLEYNNFDPVLNMEWTFSEKGEKYFKKENKEHIDYSLIEKLESNHIRTNLEYNGITIHVRSLKEYIDEDFKLFAIEEKKYLKLCKHCGKAFTAPNPKTEYDTFSCKNQENVYKSRARNKE